MRLSTAEETIPMKSKAIAEAIPTATVTFTASEAFVVYQALIGAKDAAILKMEGGSPASRELAVVRLEAVERAMRKLVASTY
jgi:hypothetical protein